MKLNVNNIKHVEVVLFNSFCMQRNQPVSKISWLRDPLGMRGKVSISLGIYHSCLSSSGQAFFLSMLSTKYY